MERARRAAWMILIASAVAVGCNLDDPLDADEDTQSSSDVSPTDTSVADTSGGIDYDGCLPAIESCNQTDDDCDGVVDEGCACNFEGREQGVCVNGLIDGSGECAEPANHIAETDSESPDHCDGRDNDCDGTTDEGCTCSAGDTQSCYSGADGTDGVGICSAGQQTCNSDGTWGECTGETLPKSEETCGDNTDQNCNGVSNDGCACDFLGTTEGVCGGQTVKTDGTCAEPGGFESPEQSCEDGRDNDCDGATDFEDGDCKKAPGELCSSDDECRSQCIASVEGSFDETRCAHRIFATSSRHKAGFGGLSGADSICNNRASAANLSGSWRALLSTTAEDAETRITFAAPLVNVTGTKIADDGADLFDGSIDAPVGVDETGSAVTSAVWTGTNESGTVARDATGDRLTCMDWNASPASREGMTGAPDTTENDWIETDTPNCNSRRRIYCVDQ